eukprot:TRINITY_DN9005_c0_g1_i3.p1 TRINITY_DN9005_c0_g1~~TRINITY_DN9005_c0_g1_i3.p1  ORF type:complete len:197 (+),score=63.06 TRINITY_DN9005_c0_g1_i3:14-604(+)
MEDVVGGYSSFVLDHLDYPFPSEHTGRSLKEFEGQFNLTLKDIVGLYELCRITQAKEILEKLQTQLNSFEPELKEEEKALYSSLQASLTSPPFPQLHQELNLLNQFLTIWHTKDTYSITHQTPDYTIYYKVLDAGIIKIRFEAIIKTELEPCFALMNEVDLYTTWVPLVLGKFGLKSAVDLSSSEVGFVTMVLLCD